MKKVKFLKLCGVYSPGEVAEVGNNEAFGLIEGGYAVTHKPNLYRTKELRPQVKRRYKTK